MSLPSHTTHVGSLPRPRYLLTAFSEQQQDKISQEDFYNVLEGSIRSVVDMQVKTGIDEVNDGEYTRLVYFGGITGLKGFTQNRLPVKFSAGDVYMAPLLTEKIEYNRDKPMSSEEVRRVKDILQKSGIERKVKFTVPSLSHLSMFYPDPDTPMIPRQFKPKIQAAHQKVMEFYPTIDDYLEEVKSIILNEVESALETGADVIQFDSPDLSFFRPTSLQEIVELNNSVISNFPKEKLEFHICWGNYENTQINTTGSFRELLPTLYDLDVGTLGPLEIFDGLRDHQELEVFRDFPLPSNQRFCAGIVNVKTRNLEPVQVLKERYQTLIEIVGPENAVVSPGCGFASAGKSRIISQESARRKLTNLTQAAKEVYEAS